MKEGCLAGLLSRAAYQGCGGVWRSGGEVVPGAWVDRHGGKCTGVSC